MAPRARKSGSGTAAEQASLVARAAAGDPEAQRRVFDAQRPMLVRLARERSDRGLPVEDLLQEGSLGVLAAIRQSPAATSDFDSLAERRAAAEMDAALEAEADARRREDQLARDANAFATGESKLRRDLGRVPTPRELAVHLHWSLERLDEVAGAVAEARERDDEELLRFLDPDEVDVLELIVRDGDGDDA